MLRKPKNMESQVRGMVLVVLLLALVLAACGGDKAEDKPATGSDDQPVNTDWRLGLITNVGGTITDGGFSESAHEGSLRAVAAYNLDYVYGISKDDADYEIQLDRQVKDNERNIIVTVGFQMEDITYEYAQQYPDVYFIGVDQAYPGLDIPDNLIGLQFAEDEAAFVVGALAGMMTQSNVIAVIGGMEIPPVVRLAEGFRNGAEYVNPDVDVLIDYTGSFGDPELGTETAQSFIDQGADVIFGAAGTTGYAGIQYAGREGVWVIGVDQDEWRTNFREGELDGSGRILTSAVKRVDSGVYQVVESIINGNPPSGIFMLDTALCGVGYAPFHEVSDAVPEEVKTMMEAIWRALAAGTLQTGVGEGMILPEALADGTLPDVPDDAPMLSECEG